MTVVFVVSAPSGAGKSTLIQRVLERDRGLVFSVSYTTREPRPGEVPGKSYHYISRKEFENLLAEGAFLEWAEVYGHYYGTHRSYYDLARSQGKDLLLDIDTEGARQLRSRLPEVVTIFVLPPSREVLERRLRSRGQDSEEAIRRRLQAAAGEAQKYVEYDYVVVNDDLEAATAQLGCIIQAERSRRHRMEPHAEQILKSFSASQQTGADQE